MSCELVGSRTIAVFFLWACCASYRSIYPRC
nr:MAG TPA: hypothetical protein [Caudoviricetes sp.]